MSIELQKLPYAYDALEPVIGKETLMFHHDKHHQTYVNNLNNLIKGTVFENSSLEEILTNLQKAPEDKKNAIKNNAGGVYNHNLYFESMIPGNNTPKGELLEKINETFKSFENFKEEFNKKGASQFGSGWVWLVCDDKKNLEIITTSNQDCPISCGKTILLGNDVWEHAYYLNYQNKRVEYLNEWFKLVNFDIVEKRYNEKNECVCNCGCSK